MPKSRFRDWVPARRRSLSVAWALVGAAFAAGLLLHSGDLVLRGAPLPKSWAVVLFLSVWCWVALRFIALWIWAWIVLAMAPVALFLGMQPYLDAPWLAPLLTAVAVASAANVVVAAWWYRWRKPARLQGDEPSAGSR